MKRGLKLTLLLALAAMPFLSGIAHAAAGEDVLRPGEKLTIGQSLVSADKHAVLVLQADGNLVEYVYYGGDWWAFWATGTDGRAVTAAVMQTDGNFVLYGYSGALWSSNTYGNPGSYLQLQSDFNLVVYKPKVPIWSVW